MLAATADIHQPFSRMPRVRRCFMRDIWRIACRLFSSKGFSTYPYGSVSWAWSRVSESENAVR